MQLDATRKTESRRAPSLSRLRSGIGLSRAKLSVTQTTMLKILWLSNRPISGQDGGTSGTWLDAMAHALNTSGEVQLCVITMGRVSSVTRQDCGTIAQWIVPASAKLGRDGLPAPRIIAEIRRIAAEYSPDVVHVWGTECYWGLLTARRLLPYPVLLDLQGLRFACARVFYGGLTASELLQCMGIKELLFPSYSLFGKKRANEKWGQFEREMIRGNRFISVQSHWLEAQLQSVKPDVRTVFTNFMLRPQFYQARPQKRPPAPIFYTSTAQPSAFKGLHVAVRALAILKTRFSNVELRIAGNRPKPGIRQDGYVRWLQREIVRLGLEKNVTWLGTQDAGQIIVTMQSCAAFLVPSFVEGYCLGLAEAMMLGVPAVASFAGGMTSLARDGETALFFPPGDAALCAYQLGRVFTDQMLADQLSRNARALALTRNEPGRILQRQLEIYRELLTNPAPTRSVLAGPDIAAMPTA